MNLPTLLVLLLVAVALFFAVRFYVRAGRRGGCSCGASGPSCRGTSGCSGCSAAPGCPHCQDKDAGTLGQAG